MIAKLSAPEPTGIIAGITKSEAGWMVSLLKASHKKTLRNICPNPSYQAEILKNIAIYEGICNILSNK